MWKFKTTKYKNAAPKNLKKEEWITDLPFTSLMQSCGNHIKASCSHMAFNLGGGSLGILPISASGRQGKAMPILHGHSDFVSDFDFSPFNDQILASCSFDCTIKIWHLPNEITENISNPEHILQPQERRVENVIWHPSAEGILSASTGTDIKIFDVERSVEKYVLHDHKDQIQGFSWKQDGSLLTTTCKDKMVRLFDPRLGPACVQEGSGHQNIKDSRIVWLGDSNQLLSTGFDNMRQREICVWDCNNLSMPLKRTILDSSTGTLIPLYDPDTKMIFFAGKGDTGLKFCEITDNDPYLTEGSTDNIAQIKGACLVPKLVLDVMSCEVNRILMLTNDAVIPLPYIVPRRNYNEYHGELFPDTSSGEPAMTADEWLAGQNKQVSKVNLDPANKRPTKSVKSKQKSVTNMQSTIDKCSESTRSVPSSQPAQNDDLPEAKEKTSSSSPSLEAKVSSLAIGSVEANKGSGRRRTFSTDEEDPNVPIITVCEDNPPVTSPTIKVNAVSNEVEILRREKKQTSFKGVRQSKFRHWIGTPLHKSNNIENIRNQSISMPGESDAFHANKDRCAVPLHGSGGLLTVLELSKPGRLPDTDVPYVQNGSSVLDFVWDPFDNSRLVVGCEDANIRVWNIPCGGLSDVLTEPDMQLAGHSEKIYCVRFHPLAKDILASTSYDMNVHVWNLESESIEILCTGHSDTIFCLSWSGDGSKFCTVSKDGFVRVYDPRKSTEPIKQGAGPQGTRGARAVWVLNDKYILVSGFDKQSERQLCVYSSENLSNYLTKTELDVSPSILVPFYDEDSATIFLTGRGDGIVFAYEIADETPYLFPLASYQTDGLHQALSFLPKSEIDVKQVEFAKAYRLTQTSIEPISFTVPRIKCDYFQDDLFPETKVTWIASMTAGEWLSGQNKPQKRISIRPQDMELLSNAPEEAPRASKYDSFNPETYKTDDEKKEELINAMMEKLEDKSDKPLPQDLTEGVDEDEWDDY